MLRFQCRICAGINFRQTFVERNGQSYRTEFYECCTCSAMFRRPDLFTSVREPYEKKENPYPPMRK